MAIVASHGNAALRGLHGVGVEIGLFGQYAQHLPGIQTLFKQRQGGIEIFRVLAPFVVEHLLGGKHFLLKREGKSGVTGDVVAHPLQLILMSGCLFKAVFEFLYGLFAVVDAFIYDVDGQFADMFLAFVLLLHILNQFLALRSATLVEARVNRELVRIDQLCHLHAEEQRLTVALGDAETTQQFGGNLACLVVGFQQMTGCDGVDAVVVAQLANPIRLVVAAMAVPCVAPPDLVPHPVAVDLKQS